MGGAPRPQGQNFGNNRLDIRQRGNATQLLDKYKTLARDAAQQGDRVVSEYYLQYADHYFRVLNEIRERQPEHQRGPRPGYDADEDGEDVGNGYNPGYAASNESQSQASADGDRDRDRDDQGQQGNQRYDQGQRDDRQPRQYEDRGQQARGSQDNRRDENRRDDNRQPERAQPERAQQDSRQPDRAQQDGRQRDEYRRDREPRNGTARSENTSRGEYRDTPRAVSPSPATSSVAKRRATTNRPSRHARRSRSLPACPVRRLCRPSLQQPRPRKRRSAVADVRARSSMRLRRTRSTPDPGNA